MTDDSSIKKYPVASGEVAKMLGMQQPNVELPVANTSHSVANLPMQETAANEENHEKHQESTEPDALENEHGTELEKGDEQKPNQSFFLKVGKAILPYLAVFSLGIFLYYFFFTGVDFGALLNSAPKISTPKESALQSLEKQNLAGYQAWISRYYYYISDNKILDPEVDNSGNGFSNFQKYLLKFNPKSYDTLGLGLADSQAVSAGINPLTGLSLTEAQKAILDKYIDMEVVSNRLALGQLEHESTVAGANINAGTTSTNGQTSVYIMNENTNIQTRGLNTTPTPSPVAGNTINKPDVSVGVDVNTEIPGRLEIPDLKINAPIMWSKAAKNFDADLQSGVIHYPGTALPGQIGTTYIAGHSSNYVWAKGAYNQVFTQLGSLAQNASFKITVVQKNGKDAIFHYAVTRSKEYLPTDQEQFKNTGKSLVALSTCWPVGSTAKRLVVFGELVRTEK